MKEKLLKFGTELFRFALIDHTFLTLMIVSAMAQDTVMIFMSMFFAMYFKLHDIYKAVQIKNIEVHPILNVQFENKKEVTQ